MGQQPARPRRPADRQQSRRTYAQAPAYQDWEQTAASQPSHPAKSRGLGWPATLAFLALAIILASVGTFFIVELWLFDRVVPGVYVWDVDLGGLTREEAIERLASDFRYPSGRTLTLHYGDRAWTVEPLHLGAQLDAVATVDTALTVGHRGQLGTQLQEQFDVLANGTMVMPAVIFDEATSRSFLSQVAAEVNRPVQDAALSLEADLSVSIHPGEVGIEVDEEATRLALMDLVGRLSGGDVDLATHESEPLLTDLSEAQAQVQRILSGPITLTAPGLEPWTIEPKTLAGWLILRPETDADGKGTLTVSLDPSQAHQLAEQIVPLVTYQPSDAQFRWDDGSGSLVPIVESMPGRTLDVPATAALIQTAATGNERTVSLPLVAIRPDLDTEDAASLGIVELVAEGKTSFAGSSASRIQNIIVGAAQFEGVMVAPDETFSFNHHLGEVTAEQGYEESIIIWGNETRADVGGGLCQVSSTAFRAAFWAGVPIVERWAHAFRVSYYEPPKGLDATIYSPSVDLKWVNDTGHHILIHTYVDEANRTLTFRYYGTKPAREVEMDGPYEENPVAHGLAVYRDDPTLPKGQTKQIEWPKDGLDVTVYRIIKENGVEVKRESVFSRYQPWEAVYLVGTKE